MSNPSVRIRVEERHVLLQPIVPLACLVAVVVLDNGILQVTLSRPAGVITGISFNGVDNLMEVNNSEDNRGYWDLVWNEPGKTRTFQRINGTKFTVISEDEDKVEISFTGTWDTSKEGTLVPLNIDKRFVMLRGCYGFYTYAIYEHKEGWPDFDMAETRVVFKLRKDKFHYMAITDDRQRIMPMPDDRLQHRGEELAYPEAVRLINPLNPDLKGEVDDKYQYSIEDKDNKVHGWICSDPPMGFWQITPSDEFRTGGPLKQDLTSHTGPITLAMFISRHYCGDELMPKFRNGEYWKKVLGPIFVHVNCLQEGNNNQNSLWEDAKAQMGIEVVNWPYSFPASEDFQKAENRGSLRGKLLVRDRYVSDDDMPANAAYVGLALPGEAGSWERECKGYQFWTRADDDGLFCISNIRTGDYNLYAWVPGFIGDYRFDESITITSGCDTDLDELLYEPPRDGPTLWEIGVADRSAAEFYVPDPDPNYINKLYVDHPDKFRQYGLWERYAHIYPDEDLVYTVGLSDYKKDWFYAHVTRKKKDGSNSYLPTTWQIKYKLDRIIQDGIYKLRMAIASAANAELQIRFNDLIVQPAHFTTGLFGEDNSIARHGIHGQHKLFHVEVKNSWLVEGENTIFLTQTRSSSPFQGIMYDYIRLEEPETAEK